jgi:hypothetical protein
MKEEFVTYDQASALKELGFNEPCLMYIDDEGDLINDDTAEWFGAIDVPLKQQVFRWFRDKYDLWFRPDYYDEMREYDYQGSIHQLGRYSSLASLDNCKTIDELEAKCIDKLIEIVKNK